MAYPTGELSVDLRAIADNWRTIRAQLNGSARCGAVVKANAYGLGVDRIAPRIYQAGCRDFFVANFKEAVQLRSLIGLDADIYVLAGCSAGAESAFIDKRVYPVLVSLPMLRRWALVARDDDRAVAALKLNSGMGRMGLEAAELTAILAAESHLLAESRVALVMSHLACADTPAHPLNARQVERFDVMVAQIRETGLAVATSFANSAGVFLGQQARGDIVRPGIALYGGNPGLATNPMQQVVGLQLPIIQLRHLPAGESVGYGATCQFDSPRLIAVVSGGYADGIMRSLSNRGQGFVLGCRVPVVGRVSMDSTMFDVTEVPGAEQLQEGDSIELLGEHCSIDDLAAAAGTISYEILTSLGARYQRCYIS